MSKLEELKRLYRAGKLPDKVDGKKLKRKHLADLLERHKFAAGGLVPDDMDRQSFLQDVARNQQDYADQLPGDVTSEADLLAEIAAESPSGAEISRKPQSLPEVSYPLPEEMLVNPPQDLPITQEPAALPPEPKAPVLEKPIVDDIPESIKRPDYDMFAKHSELIQKEVDPKTKIKRLQQELNEAGFTDDEGKPLAIDGVMGKRTRQALEKQKYFKSEPVDRVASFISKSEGTDLKKAQKAGFGSEYDVPYGYGKFVKPEKSLSQMSLDEVRKFQTKQIGATKGKIPGTDLGSGAVGKYQFVRTTLDGLIKRMKKKGLLTGKENFSPEVQDKVFKFMLLHDAGGKDFLEGKISSKKFQDKLASKWASIPDSKGKFKYGQPSIVKDYKEITKNLESMKDPSLKPGPALSSLDSGIYEDGGVVRKFNDGGFLGQSLESLQDELTPEEKAAQEIQAPPVQEPIVSPEQIQTALADVPKPLSDFEKEELAAQASAEAPQEYDTESQSFVEPGVSDKEVSDYADSTGEPLEAPKPTKTEKKQAKPLAEGSNRTTDAIATDLAKINKVSKDNKKAGIPFDPKAKYKEEYERLSKIPGAKAKAAKYAMMANMLKSLVDASSQYAAGQAQVAGGFQVNAPKSTIPLAKASDFYGKDALAGEGSKERLAALKALVGKKGTTHAFQQAKKITKDGKTVIFDPNLGQYIDPISKTPVNSGELIPSYVRTVKDPLTGEIRELIPGEGIGQTVAGKPLGEVKPEDQKEYKFNMLNSEQRKQFDKIENDYMKDVADSREFGEILVSIDELVDSDISAAIPAIKRQLARSVGKEVGVMTDKDVAAFSGDQSLMGALRRFAKLQTSGKMTEEDKRQYRGIIAIARRNIEKSMKNRGDYHINRLQQRIPGATAGSLGKMLSIEQSKPIGVGKSGPEAPKEKLADGEKVMRDPKSGKNVVVKDGKVLRWAK